jgi:hypothetical protein
VTRERIDEVDFRVPAHEPDLSLWLLSLTICRALTENRASPRLTSGDGLVSVPLHDAS